MKRVINDLKISGMIWLCLACAGLAAHSQSQVTAERIEAARGEGSLSNLQALGKEVHGLRSTNSALYFKLQEQVGAALEEVGRTNGDARLALEEQAGKVLAEDSPTNPPSAIACFSAKRQTAERLARNSAQVPNLRNARALARFLGEIRATMIRDYKHAKVVGNVTPPTWSEGVIMSGMDPNAIADPKARADYENAIAENRMNNYRNGLYGRVLPEADASINKIVIYYLRNLFTQHPESKGELDALAALARLTPAERDQIEAK